MGWARTLLLGDIGNRLDIADAESDIYRLWAEVNTQGSTDKAHSRCIHDLEKENQELKAYLALMIHTLVQKDVLTKDDLEAFVDLIEGSTEPKA